MKFIVPISYFFSPVKCQSAECQVCVSWEKGLLCYSCGKLTQSSNVFDVPQDEYVAGRHFDRFAKRNTLNMYISFHIKNTCCNKD